MRSILSIYYNTCVFCFVWNQISFSCIIKQEIFTHKIHLCISDCKHSFHVNNQKLTWLDVLKLCNVIYWTFQTGLNYVNIIPFKCIIDIKYKCHAAVKCRHTKFWSIRISHSLVCTSNQFVLDSRPFQLKIISKRFK